MGYKEDILAYLKLVDPNEEIVQIDTENHQINYHKDIICHQQPKYENEGFVRAYLVAYLVIELKYPPNCIELENDLNVQVGRTKTHKGTDRGRSDVLVFRRTEEKESLFLAIECKTPNDYDKGKNDIDGQLWGITKAKSIQSRVQRNIHYLAYYTVEAIGGVISDRVLLVDFQRFPTYQEWEVSEFLSGNVLPAQYEDAPQSQYGNVDKNNENSKLVLKPLRKNYTQKDFEKLRDKLHNLLWAGSSSDDNAIFYQLTKIFLVKIYDEMHTQPDEPYSVQIRSTQKGQETIDELYQRLSKLYEIASRQMLNYDTEDLSRFPFLIEGFTKKKLFVAVSEIQGISISENEVASFDVLGSFFEGIMTNQEFFKQSKGTYFTHPYIVRFMLAMVGVDEIATSCLQLDVPRLPYIIDPSSGSGTFLIEAMKYVTARVTQSFSKLKINRVQREFYESNFQRKEKPNVWAEDYIYGIEPRPELGLAAKVNMILHGDGNMALPQFSGE